MLVSPSLTNQVVICPTRLQRDVKNFLTTMVHSTQDKRFVTPQPFFFDIPDAHAATYVEALEQVISRKDPQLIMCVVANNHLDHYTSIKKICRVDRAVPTQVTVAKSLNTSSVMSVATKVLIRMALSTIEIPPTGLMMVWIDVCHDIHNRATSYADSVASLNKTFSHYFSTVAHNTSREELSNYWTASIAKALHK